MTTIPKPAPPKNRPAVAQEPAPQRSSRPEHKDFYLLSSIVNRMDSMFDPEAMSQEEMSARFIRLVEANINYECLEYMSGQRILLMLMNNPPVFFSDQDMNRLANAYLEGFMVGAAVVTRRNEQEQS